MKTLLDFHIPQVLSGTVLGLPELKREQLPTLEFPLSKIAEIVPTNLQPMLEKAAPGLREALRQAQAFAGIDQLPHRNRDDFARCLYDAKVAELGDADQAMAFMNALPLDERQMMMDALRKQVSPFEAEKNRPLVEGMYAPLERDAFDHEWADLKIDPAKRSALKQQLLANLTASANEPSDTVTIEGKSFALKKPAEHQPALDEIYSIIDAYMAKNGAPGRTDMTRMLLGGPSEDRVEASTVFVRPGLGNVHPTIWWFAEMATHLEPDAKMVLAYSWTDNKPGSELRPASKDPYLQNQLAIAEAQIRRTMPKDEASQAIASLRASISKLYLQGSPRHTFQDYEKSGAQFVKQFLDIESAVQKGEGFGLDLSRPVTFAHSQGNMDSNLLRGFFAAAGRTRPTIGEIYGLAPATSGAPIAEGDRALELLLKLLGGDSARASIADLAQANARKHVARALMVYNEATAVSDVETTGTIPKGQNLPGLAIGDRVNRILSAAGGGDALVSKLSRYFVRDQRNAFELGPYDHYGMFAWGSLHDFFGQWKNIQRDGGARRAELDAMLASAD